jgi:phosphoglycerate-specific signal transduction histidine kinase
LKDSEHKRHESLRKTMELQRRILELEEELRVAKAKIKEIIVRKASVVLREQYL